MKTIEQAAQEYAKSLNLKGHDSFDFETYAKQDFKAGVEFAQRLISVDEELPKKDTQVLVKWSNGIYGTNQYFQSGGFWQYQFDKITITHWRPIELE